MSMGSLATRISMTPSRQLPGRIFVAGKGQRRSHAVNLVFEEPAPLVLQDNEHIVSYCTYISWTLYRFAVPFLVCAEVPLCNPTLACCTFTQVATSLGEAHWNLKAYNGRVVCAWLADCCVRLARTKPCDETLMMAACMLEPQCQGA